MEIYETKIAGINYHLSVNDKSSIGLVFGYCMLEPSNKYNQNAIAIYTNRNKLLGYISEEDLEDFTEWSDKQVTKFVGITAPFIGDDNEPLLYGKVTFVRGEEKEIENAMQKLSKDYSKELDEALNDVEHKLRNITDIESLKSNSHKEEDSNSGCLGVIMIGVISIITALLI